MKTASTALTNLLAQANSVKATPKLIVEWNLNQYFNVLADNIPAEDSSGFDLEMFPIESIFKANRPTKGINKARVGEGLVSSEYVSNKHSRYYIADYDDTYKYWTSPSPSNASTGALTNCQPHIIYGTKGTTGNITYQNVSANKIVIKVENSWAAPLNFSVEARINGQWTSIFTQANITDTTWERKGELILYYNGTTWRQNNPAAPTALLTTLSGVRLNVTSLKGGVQPDGTTTSYTTSEAPTTFIATNGRDAHFNLIEISARREANLTSDLVSVQDSLEIGESSNLYPIGTITNNVGSLSLWNGENTYSADNSSSPYASLLEPNAKLTLSYLFEVNNVIEEVKEFVMYADSWSGQRSEEATVDFTDFSKFFQEEKPRPAMWENLTVAQIIYRLCDSIGFNNYVIDSHSAVTNFIIPVFWTDGEKNMWETLNELAAASQTAIYFDGFGVLRVKTREAALDNSRAPQYTLRGEPSGLNLTNIISVDQETEYQANTVSVTYQKTRWSDYNDGQPSLQKVWEPEGTLAIRSTPLTRSLGLTDAYFYISSSNVKYWPFEGLANIDSEIIRYSGKEYTYYTYVGSTETKNTTMVKSAEEQEKFNLLTPLEYRYKNALTGGLKIAEKNGVQVRGEWNTTAQAHSVDAAGYSVRRKVGSTRTINTRGLIHHPSTSTVELATSTGYKREADYLLATIGTSQDSGYWFYGTKMSFIKDSSMTHQRAGLIINNDGSTQENGYFIEITPSKRMSAATRKTRNELMVYTRVGGVLKPIGTGAKIAIGENIAYTIDVAFKVFGSTHQVKVWVNGRLYYTANITGTNKNTISGKWGMFAMGRTRASYEYIYANRREETNDPADDFSSFDKRSGAAVSDLFKYEWVYRTMTATRIIKKKSTQVTYKYNEKYFDEFGPYVHEIREFDVKFEPNPVLHSKPFLTNDWCAALLEYSSTPFGAKFVVANIARITGIINGEDTLTFAGSGEAVDQIFTVFGRPLVIDEAEEKEFVNELQVQRRGKIEVELNSPWMQSEEMASAVGEWILKTMAYGNDELVVPIFGNPLIEVTDVVDVFYAKRNLNGQKYVVTKVDNAFEQGITTTLTLRRINPVVS